MFRQETGLAEGHYICSQAVLEKSFMDEAFVHTWKQLYRSIVLRFSAITLLLVDLLDSGCLPRLQKYAFLEK